MVLSVLIGTQRWGGTLASTQPRSDPSQSSVVVRWVCAQPNVTQLTAAWLVFVVWVLELSALAADVYAELIRSDKGVVVGAFVLRGLSASKEYYSTTHTQYCTGQRPAAPGSTTSQRGGW